MADATAWMAEMGLLYGRQAGVLYYLVQQQARYLTTCFGAGEVIGLEAASAAS